jgi:predicted nucleic acid-binding protein
MRYLLDTNIISNVTRPAPSDALLGWMAEQSDGNLYIAALTVAEILRGILEKPAGKRRREAGSSAPMAPKPCSPDACCRSMSGRRSRGRV